MTRDDILAEGLPVSDAEIAGFMRWRGPGAYTAHIMRKVKEVIAEAVMRERKACAKVCDDIEHESENVNGCELGALAAGACADRIRTRKGGAT